MFGRRSTLPAQPVSVSDLGWLGYKLSLDLLWFHTNLLMGALGATLLLLLGFLSLLVYHCR